MHPMMSTTEGRSTSRYGVTKTTVAPYPRMQTGTAHVNVRVNHAEMGLRLKSEAPSLYTVNPVAGMQQPSRAELTRAATDEMAAGRLSVMTVIDGEPVFILRDADPNEPRPSMPGDAGNDAVSIVNNLNAIRLTDRQAQDVRSGSDGEARVAHEIEDQLVFLGFMDPVDTRQDTGGGYSTAQVSGPKSLTNTGNNWIKTGELVEWAVATPSMIKSCGVMDDAKNGSRPVAILRAYNRSDDNGKDHIPFVQQTHEVLQGRLRAWHSNGNAEVRDSGDFETQLDRFLHGGWTYSPSAAVPKASGAPRLFLLEEEEIPEETLSHEPAVDGEGHTLPLTKFQRRLVEQMVASILFTGSPVTMRSLADLFKNLRPQHWMRFIRACTALVQGDRAKIVGRALETADVGKQLDLLEIPNTAC